MSKNTDLGSLVNYIKGQVTGRLNAPAYTSATAFTGTIAGYLGFDTSGNILTSAGVGFTGSGTTNYISKFTGSTALGNSQIFDDGTSIDIGNTNGTVGKLNVTGRIALTSSLFFSSNLTSEDRWEINVASPANDLYFQRSGVGERMRITNAGGVNINTSTTGYTLNAITSTSTQFNTVYKSSGASMQVMSRFMSDTSANKGIAIGYYNSEAVSGIWATQSTGILMLGVLDGSTYKSKLRIDTTTVAIDIPTSSSGLASGQLWNDGTYVRIT